MARRGDKPTSERGTVQAPSSSGQFGVRPSGPTSRSRSSCRSNPSYVIYARLLLSHIIRTVPPNVVAPAIRNMMPECLGSAPSDAVYRVAAFAGLPASLGSLGVQNTKRTAPAAYWAVPLWQLAICATHFIATACCFHPCRRWTTLSCVRRRVFASWRMTDKCTFRACAHVGACGDADRRVAMCCEICEGCCDSYFREHNPRTNMDTERRCGGEPIWRPRTNSHQHACESLAVGQAQARCARIRDKRSVERGPVPLLPQSLPLTRPLRAPPA